MNPKCIFLSLFIVLISVSLVGQSTISFSYDDNGNRTGRFITAVEIPEGSASFPQDSPDIMNLKLLSNSSKGSGELKLSGAEAKNSESILINDSGIRTKVYPNPTTGHLGIEIINMPADSDSENELRLYDMNGTVLVIEKDFDRYHQIDISGFKDGMYILKIRVNKNLFDWKIVKNQ